MKLSIKLATLSAASLLATSAFANIPGNTVLPAKVSTNSVYISGDAGLGVLYTPDLNMNIEFPLEGYSYKNGSFAGGVNLGFNHAFNPNVLAGAEFGWNYNGQSKYEFDFAHNYSTTNTISSYDLHLLATATYLFNNGFNVFGKAGVARVYQTGKGTTNIPDTEALDISETSYQPMLAAGLGYQIKMVNIFVQYSHIFGKDPNDVNDLFDNNGDFNGTVAADTIKAGLAVSLAI
jgi:opacity protein-like surface antigen